MMEQLHRLAGGAVRRAKDGAELRAGQGDHLSAAALEALTLFLREAGAPLDNNLVERALKQRCCTGRTRCSTGR